MIPRKIHYCWFGGRPFGKKERCCMESWSRYCSDWEIVRWDENNTSIDDNEYIKEAYAIKKWAFVSDYIRLKALYEQGGIYLDTDVELKKPLDFFLGHEAFMCFEDTSQVATCVIGAEAGHPFVKQILEKYRGLIFVGETGEVDLTTNVKRVTAWLMDEGLIPNGQLQQAGGVTIYPRDYFCPKDLETGRITLTDRTYGIHHFSASWMPVRNRIHTRLAQLLGPTRTKQIKRLLGRE